MTIAEKLNVTLRGDVSSVDIAREILRRRKAAKRLRKARGEIDTIRDDPARLVASAQKLTEQDLSACFRNNKRPYFWTNAGPPVFAAESRVLADQAVAGSLQLAGLGTVEYAGADFWRRDPLTGHDWGLEFHADIDLQRHDGVDVRVLWELNRFGHVIPLAAAYEATGDEVYAETFFSHLEDWIQQNPYGRGANWGSAMEVALRAVNVLAAFDACRGLASLSGERIQRILKFIDQHGRFITANSEFSYIATSNHYLANVVGLFWIGTLIPELEHAAEWQRFGLDEIISEVEKQVLPDGADYESSTGYHRFVTEMLVYTVLLADRNSIAVQNGYRQKLRAMLDHLAGITKPDGKIPLIGDADGSQFIPTVQRDAHDATYLLEVGPAVRFAPRVGPEIGSAGFPDAGAYVFRHDDLYLYLNVNDCGLNGRGSHAHNDALSIEVSALGATFIVDPGSYVYNLDRSARHRFRSTEYHSTVLVDQTQQNTTDVDKPFILGNEARPSVIRCELGGDPEIVTAEHHGYERLKDPVMHRRTVNFFRKARCWSVSDELLGSGAHELVFTFHIGPAVDVQIVDSAIVRLVAADQGQLIIRQRGIPQSPHLTPASCSRNYGHSEASTLLTWKVEATVPSFASFLLIPVKPNENWADRLANAIHLAENIDG